MNPTKALYSRLSHHAVLPDGVETHLAGVTLEIMHFEPGEVVVRRGQEASKAFVACEGWAARSISLSDGRTQIVNFMLPGDIFDLQVFTGQPADHTVRALTPVKVAALSRDKVVEIFTVSSPLAAAMWWASVQEEAILREQVVRNGRRSARERVAHLLLELHERLRMIGEVDGDSFVLPVSQSHIADALGLSYVHVSRVLGYLEKSGFIERRRSRVTLLDRQALAKLCDFSTLYLTGGEGKGRLG